MGKEAFRDNVVLITGASRGIGRDMALQLATQGAHLALAARDGQLLAQVAQECRERGAQAVALPADVSDPAQDEQLVARTVSNFGRLDTLVNNAGLGMWARFEEVRDLSIFEQIMRVNYLGSLYLTHYALPYLKTAHGRIVVVSSVAGKFGVPYRSGYGASKHALSGFFESLRIELDGTGVSVTIAYPDFVATGIQARNFGPDGKPLGANPVQVDKVMSSEDCARQILAAAARRKRELLMSSRARWGQWIRLVAPGIADRVALRAIQQGK